MVHASLFSGIGGPEVAAAMLGWHNAFHCEINDFCRKILEYWFPNSKSYENIIETDFTEWRGKVDVLTGGFPCQPFSYAGQRKGHEDDRYLWPQMLRAITEIRPNWVIGENVAGITTMAEQGKISEVGCEESLFGEGDGLYHYRQRQIFTIERVCRDLEGAGYSVQPVIIPACAVGAPHRRDRIFIIANYTDISHAGGESRADDRKEKEKGIQERNDNRKFGEPSEVRQEDSGVSDANTSINGDRTQKKNGGAKEEGSIIQQQSEWGEQTEWPDGLPELQRIDTNTYSALLSRWDSEGSSEGGPRQGTEPLYCEKVETGGGIATDTTSIGRRKIHKHIQSELTNGEKFVRYGRKFYATDSESEWGGEVRNTRETSRTREGDVIPGIGRGLYDKRAGLKRWDSFPTVSPVHRGNDGLPFDVDHLTIPFAKWRTESLKAYGNAIVPQVMYEIFLAIERIENGENRTN